MQDQFSNPYSLQGRKANSKDPYLESRDRLYRYQINKGYASKNNQSPISDEEPERGQAPHNPEARTVNINPPTFYEQPANGNVYNRNNIQQQFQRQEQHQAMLEHRTVNTFHTLAKKQEWERNFGDREREIGPEHLENRLRHWVGPHDGNSHHSRRDEEQVQKNRKFQTNGTGYYQNPSSHQDYPILPKPATGLYNSSKKQIQSNESGESQSRSKASNYKPGQGEYREISANDILSLGSNMKGMSTNANPNSINMNINNMYIFNNSNGLDMNTLGNNPNMAQSNQANTPGSLGIDQIRMDLKGATVTGQSQGYQARQSQNINSKNGQKKNTGGVTLTSQKKSKFRQERKLIRGIRKGPDMERIRSTHFDYEQQFEDIKDSGCGQGSKMQSQNKARKRKPRHRQKKAVQRPKNSNTKFYSPVNPRIESLNSISQNQKGTRMNRSREAQDAQKQTKSKKQDFQHQLAGNKLNINKNWKRDTSHNKSQPKNHQTPSLPVTPSKTKNKSKSKRYFRNQEKEHNKKTYSYQPKLYSNKNTAKPKSQSRKFKARTLNKKSNQSPYKVYTSPSNTQQNSAKPGSKFISQDRKISKSSFDEEKRISDFDRSKIKKLQRKFGGLDLEKLDMGNRVHKMNSNQIIKGKRDFNTTGELKFNAGRRQPKSHLASISVQYGPGLTSRGTRPVLYQ